MLNASHIFHAVKLVQVKRFKLFIVHEKHLMQYHPVHMHIVTLYLSSESLLKAKGFHTFYCMRISQLFGLDSSGKILVK